MQHHLTVILRHKEAVTIQKSGNVLVSIVTSLLKLLKWMKVSNKGTPANIGKILRKCEKFMIFVIYTIDCVVLENI